MGKLRTNKSTIAYIAGFLDGDGSIVLQFKPRKDRKLKFIDGYERVRKLLIQLKPYTRFKKKQVEIILEAIKILQREGINKESFLRISELSDKLAKYNYPSYQRRYTGETIRNVIASIDS